MRKRKNRFPAMYAIIVVVAIIISGTIGGSLAWLADSTQKVQNTFTVGNIDIELKETDSDDTDADADNNSYKMVPGNVIEKDPKVTILAGSEACWLFVKIEEGNGLDKFINYNVSNLGTNPENEWVKMDDESGIYYRKVNSDVANTGVSYNIIGYYNENNEFVENKVIVNDSVEKDDMDAFRITDSEGNYVLAGGKYAYDTTKFPTLTFKAAAVQSDLELTNAWTEAKKLLD